MDVFIVYDDAFPVDTCVRGIFLDMEDAIELVGRIAYAKDFKSENRNVWVEKVKTQ